jgi:hypothetical protein
MAEMKQMTLLLILTSSLLTACGARSPDIEATVQSAIAGTQTAQTVVAAVTPALPTPTARAPLTSGTPALTSTLVSTPEPPPLAPTSVPSPTSQAPTPAEAPASAEMADGTILFIKESKIVSGTEAIESYELYSIAAGKVSLVASDLPLQWVDLSPDGTKVASRQDFAIGSEGKLRVIALDPHGGAAKITPYGIPDKYEADSQRRISSLHWSPDTTKLAVQTDCSLYVLALATGEFVEIWHECYPEVTLHEGIIDVAWSPDSTQLAFTVVTPSKFPSSNLRDDLHGEYPAKLLVADADGKAHVVLDEEGSRPVWSPDGRQVVYRAGWRRDSDGDVYTNEKLRVMRADGTGRVQLAETTGRADDSWTHPYYEGVLWSSDRGHVFFTLGRPNQTGQLNVVRSDGTGGAVLGGEESDWVENWPGGDRIAWRERLDPASYAIFVSNPDGADKIEWDRGADLSGLSFCGDKVLWSNGHTWVVANLDGSARRELPGTDDYPWLQPFFSPDCSQVVLSRAATGDDQISSTDLTSANDIPLLTAESGEEFYVQGWVSAPADTRSIQ